MQVLRVFSCHTTPYNLINSHGGRHGRTALSNAIRAALCCGVPGFISRPWHRLSFPLCYPISLGLPGKFRDVIWP